MPIYILFDLKMSKIVNDMFNFLCTINYTHQFTLTRCYIHLVSLQSHILVFANAFYLFGANLYVNVIVIQITDPLVK